MAKGKGGAWCAAPHCHHSHKKGWRMFRFPRNEARCRQWVQNCGRDDLRNKPVHYLNTNCHLCIDHFEDSQFWNVTKKAELGLLSTALPTIFNIPNPPPKRTTTRPRPARTDPSPKRARVMKKLEIIPTSSSRGPSVSPLSAELSDTSVSACPMPALKSAQLTAESSLGSFQPTDHETLPNSLGSTIVCDHRVSHEQLEMPDVKVEVDIAEEPGPEWTTQDQSSHEDIPSDLSKRTAATPYQTEAGFPLAINIKSEPVEDAATCEDIDTEPVNQNVTSQASHDFLSEPVEKKRRKVDVKSEQSSFYVDLSCVTTDSRIELNSEHVESKSWDGVSDIKCEPIESNASNSSSDTVPSESMSNVQPSGDEKECDEPFTTSQAPRISWPAASIKAAFKTTQSFACDVCSKTFRRAHNLKFHKKGHSGERPFVCEVCNQAFTWPSNLKVHKMIHTGERSFVCDICNKAFRKSDSLKSHKLTHLNAVPKPDTFVCDLCNKAFTQACYLRKHKKTHTDQRRFKCDVCKKAFTRERYLKQHTLIHTVPEEKDGIRPKLGYEAIRERKFQESWLRDFPWVKVDNPEAPTLMFCKTCLDQPQIADQKGNLFVGCSSFRKASLQSHAVSVRHQMCVEAQKAAASSTSPADQPDDNSLCHVEEERREQVMKLFNTAYYVFKLELPFSSYPSLLRLQEKNGLDLGDSWKTDCSRFLGDIFQALFEPKLAAINKAKAIGILVDTVADCRSRDLVCVYVRYLSEGVPTSCFIAIEELQNSNAEGYIQAIDRALDGAGIQSWRERTVSVGSDGAAVMVDKNGVSTRLKKDIPWIVPLHCLPRGLELATRDCLKQHQDIQKVETMLHMLYKQYRCSPKAWQELPAVTEALEEKVWKVTHPRWLSCFTTALEMVIKHLRPLVTTLRKTTADEHSRSMEMRDGVKEAVKKLTDHRQLMFFHVILDVLSTVNRLSLELQKDEVTLLKLIQAFETALLQLHSLRTSPGEQLKAYQHQARDRYFRGIRLSHFGQEVTDNWTREKNAVLDSVHTVLANRFEFLESNPVLSAAGKVIDPREWPEDADQLAAFGAEEVQLLLGHFAELLTQRGCNIHQARVEEWPALKTLVKKMTVRDQNPALWSQFLVDLERRKDFANFLCLVEILLILPVSTASVEKGVPTIERIQSDWRAKLDTETLSMLTYISVEGPDVEDYSGVKALERWWQSEPSIE